MRGRRGFSLPTLVVCLPVPIAMLGLAADLGHVYTVKSELQGFVDATALAASMELDGTSAGLQNARNVAEGGHGSPDALCANAGRPDAAADVPLGDGGGEPGSDAVGGCATSGSMVWLAWALLVAAPPEEDRALLDVARAAPAEIAADALLRLGASRPALLEEAFQTAARAEYPYRRRYVGPVEGGSSTREWLLDRAQAMELDTLSIQARAVRALLPLDARKARELFQRIAPPSLPAFTCEDALVPEVGAFWQTLQLVADQGFSAEERKREEHVALLASRVGAIGSVVELAPAAVAIRVARLTPEQRSVLVATYARRLAEVGGVRYAFAARQFDIANRVVALEEAAGSDALMRAWREFLVRYAAGVRCADREYDHRVFWEPFANGWIEQFNERLRLMGTEQPAIAEEEIGAPHQEGKARLERLYTSSEARELDAALSAFKSGGKEEQAEECITRLEAWSSESLEEKSDYYIQLLGALPQGPLAARAIKSYVAFLGEHPVQKSHPVEWLFEVRRLLELAKAPARPAGPFEDVEPPHENAAAIREELLRARDPLLVLEARLGER